MKEYSIQLQMALQNFPGSSESLVMIIHCALNAHVTHEWPCSKSKLSNDVDSRFILTNKQYVDFDGRKWQEPY